MQKPNKISNTAAIVHYNQNGTLGKMKYSNLGIGLLLFAILLEKNLLLTRNWFTGLDCGL